MSYPFSYGTAQTRKCPLDTPPFLSIFCGKATYDWCWVLPIADTVLSINVCCVYSLLLSWTCWLLCMLWICLPPIRMHVERTKFEYDRSAVAIPQQTSKCWADVRLYHWTIISQYCVILVIQNICGPMSTLMVRLEKTFLPLSVPPVLWGGQAWSSPVQNRWSCTSPEVPLKR